MTENTNMAADTAAEAANTEQQSAQPTPADDVGKLVTKESRKAVEKLLKDAGITPAENPEMQLKEYKNWLDSQKSALEKANGSVTTITGERDAALAELTATKNSFTALAKGIPADKANKYVKLAESYMGDGVAFEAALDAALKDFPATTEKPAVPGAGGNPPAAEQHKPAARPKGVMSW